MLADDPYVVKTTVVACNGGGGPLGHPVVYLNLGDEGEAVCPYCSRRYVLDEDVAVSGGH